MRRLRWGQLPKPPETVKVPYAKCNSENYDDGELVAWLVSRPEWDETIGAECDAIDETSAAPLAPPTTRLMLELLVVILAIVVPCVAGYALASAWTASLPLAIAGFGCVLLITGGLGEGDARGRTRLGRDLWRGFRRARLDRHRVLSRGCPSPEACASLSGNRRCWRGATADAGEPPVPGSSSRVSVGKRSAASGARSAG